MKNFVQSGDTLPLTAPAALASGDVVVIGSIVGVATTSAASGANFTCAIRGVFDLPKTNGVAFAPGDKVYFDSTAKLITSTATNNTRLGAAVLPAIASATTARVHLDGAHI
jgi:predicted RecA/RadA family phage recombinase